MPLPESVPHNDLKAQEGVARYAIDDAKPNSLTRTEVEGVVSVQYDAL